MKRYDGLNQAMVERFATKPGRKPLLPELSAKAQVALMCRILFREGWNEHIAGHITWRLDNGNTLHTVGTAGRVKEASPDSEVVWDVNFSGFRLMGRGEFIEDLYDFVSP